MLCPPLCCCLRQLRRNCGEIESIATDTPHLARTPAFRHSFPVLFPGPHASALACPCGRACGPAAIAALTEATTLYAEAAPFGLPPEAQSNRTQALWGLGDLHFLTGNGTAALAPAP